MSRQAELGARITRLDQAESDATSQLERAVKRVPRRTRVRYVADHQLLHGAGGLGEPELLGFVARAEESGSADDWRRALIQLAHHRSEVAATMLAGLEARVPRPLHGYWELARAEGAVWLRYPALAS
jgi:hypothetical protein